MHDVACEFARAFVRSKDAQKQLARTSLSLYPLRSSALEAKYCDDDFVDEEDKTRPSSGVLILALGCEISANLEPDFVSRVHFSQQLWPDPHESNMKHVTPQFWMRQTADGGRLLAQVTRDKIFFWICKIVFWI